MLVFVGRIVKPFPSPSGSILRYPALNFNRISPGEAFLFYVVYQRENVYIKRKVLMRCVMFSKKSLFAVILPLIFLAGCAGAPIRPVLKERRSPRSFREDRRKPIYWD
jgi:hypothetical protein